VETTAEPWNDYIFAAIVVKICDDGGGVDGRADFCVPTDSEILSADSSLGFIPVEKKIKKLSENKEAVKLAVIRAASF
jgi:hypothetical protein